MTWKTSHRTLIVLGTTLVLAFAGCTSSEDDAVSNEAASPTSAEVEVDVTADETESDPDETEADPAETSDETENSTPTEEEETSETVAVSGPTIPGYTYGTFPEVPMITLPDLSMLDETAATEATNIAEQIAEYPGLEVSTGHCDEAGNYAGANGTVLYGDGSAVMDNADDQMINNGDGSGMFTINGVDVVTNGDGSGMYSDPPVQIISNGDGSGVYGNDESSVIINGDGSGSSNVDGVGIINNGDGSGSYDDGTMAILNNGDGSGAYEDSDFQIINNGDGTGYVNGEETEMDALAPLAPVGDFPSMEALKPVEVCGTTITLADSILFDFDSHELRPEANEVLAVVAQALNDLDIAVVQVFGHTDSLGSDSYNMDLSNRRASAVGAALLSAGSTAEITSEGLGETHPVAPNEIDGQDNPAGRQLNRRVEIFIPS